MQWWRKTSGQKVIFPLSNVDQTRETKETVLYLSRERNGGNVSVCSCHNLFQLAPIIPDVVKQEESQQSEQSDTSQPMFTLYRQGVSVRAQRWGCWQVGSYTLQTRDICQRWGCWTAGSWLERVVGHLAVGCGGLLAGWQLVVG